MTGGMTSREEGPKVLTVRLHGDQRDDSATKGQRLVELPLRGNQGRMSSSRPEDSRNWVVAGLHVNKILIWGKSNDNQLCVRKSSDDQLKDSIWNCAM